MTAATEQPLPDTQPIRVMIVDDSSVIRGLLQRTLKEEPGLDVVAAAFNGAMAVSLIQRTEADVILLDIEMPEMDGLTALPQLIQHSPGTHIIMVSTLTLRNAEISLKALELGASDYVTKPSSRDEGEVQQFFKDLIAKIKAFGHKRQVPLSALQALKPVHVVQESQTEAPRALGPVDTTVRYPSATIKALAIGSSTGGPQALTGMFKALGKAPLPVPVFITQHMPATFTTILAQHISQQHGWPCAEAKDGERVRSGTVYLAPGDFHMVAEQQGGDVVLRLNKNPPVNFCRPAVDPMLQSLVPIYGKHLLTVILTGMGSDGLEGSRKVVEAGGTVVAQNEQTCVVWGMPRAVTENKLCSAVLPLGDIPAYIRKACA